MSAEPGRADTHPTGTPADRVSDAAPAQVYEFVTLDGVPVAEYDGDPDRMTHAADATAALLGLPLAVRLKEAADV